MIDRRVSTACLVASTTLSSNARVDAVRAKPRKKVVVDRVAHWDSATWPRGDHYTLFARAAFKGSGSSRATTVGFALEGRGGAAPHRQWGSTRGAAGVRRDPGSRSETRTPRLPFDHKEPVCFVRGLRPCSPSGEGTAQTPRFPPRAPLSGGSAPRRIRFPFQHRSWRSARVTGAASLPESTRH